MTAETNIEKLISGMTPKLNEGAYVFVSVSDVSRIDRQDTICEFKEEEGITVILEKNKADELNLQYDYIAAWITLKIHSSLEAVGLTAAFSNELAKHHISSNFVAGYYHDHIFVDRNDGERAVIVLKNLAENGQK